MARPTTILFNGHDFKFLRLLMSRYEQDPNFEVLIDDHPGHVVLDTKKSKNLLTQADIIFCEWCLGNAEWYSHNKKEHQPLIVRFHRQEITTPYLEKINWDNVDRLIFICQEMMDQFLRRFPAMKNRSNLIYNLIDCQLFDTPKLYGAEFNLGLLGASPKLKAPHVAFEILAGLKKIDKRYTLSMKGKHPWEYDWLWRRPEEKQYYEDFYNAINQSEFANSVVFDQHGDDVPEWFSKIGFLLSTSDLEGSHQAVAEGMASGAIPIIRNWAGADSLYPKRNVFNTTDEAIELIHKWNTNDTYIEECENSKKYAKEHFCKSVIIKEYDTLISEFLKQKDKKTPTEEINRATVHSSNDTQTFTVMHVCYLSPASQSGYEIRVIEETALLKKLGFPVVIVCFIGANQFFPLRRLWGLYRRLREFTDAKIYIIPTNHYFDLSDSSENTKWIVSPLVTLARLHNVKIIHGQALYSTVHILRAREKINVKVAFDVHGISPEETEMSGGHISRINRLAEWETKALNSVDLRIFVSNRMRDFFKEKYGLPELPYALVPCCVHKEKFQIPLEVRNEKRKELGINDKFVLLYLGTLSVWQWPEAMFNLFSEFYNKMPNSIFYLMLPETDHQRALSFIEEYQLPQESYILEEVPHTEVGAKIGLADAGLLLRKSHPVNYASCPTKFGEYMAAGVPVIATEGIGDISDIITNKQVGLLVSPDEDERISAEDLEKFLRFADNVIQNREELSQRCIEVSETYLDWDEHSRILANAYRTINIPPPPKKT